MKRRLYLIANPKGGVGDNLALANRASAVLKEHGMATEVHLTEYAGHARELAERLDCREGEAICGIGGDGTMHELINGIMARAESHRVTLGLLPGGTGNSFLRDMGYLDPAVVLERIASNQRRSVDLFEVRVGGQVHYGCNVVGWGMFSAGNQVAEKLRCLGSRRYDIAGLWQILVNRRFRGTLKVKGQSVEGGFVMIAACNTRHSGAGMLLAPEAQLDDGKLDLFYLKEMTRARLMRLFLKLGSGTHLGEPGVCYRQVERLSVSTPETLPINLDGELVPGGSFEVIVRPGALQFLA